jgi:hypothetical protein
MYMGWIGRISYGGGCVELSAPSVLSRVMKDQPTLPCLQQQLFLCKLHAGDTITSGDFRYTTRSSYNPPQSPTPNHQRRGAGWVPWGKQTPLHNRHIHSSIRSVPRTGRHDQEVTELPLCTTQPYVAFDYSSNLGSAFWIAYSIELLSSSLPAGVSKYNHHAWSTSVL